MSEVLAECQMCRSQHGSAVKAHLKMKKELACKQVGGKLLLSNGLNHNLALVFPRG
jgi:hypothetical protein